jgi:hypothetical protein
MERRREGTPPDAHPQVSSIAPAWDRLGFTGRVPVLTTVWRLLVRVDAETLTAVLADWLCSRVSAPPPVRRVIAVDGKVVRGAVLTEGRVHLLSAYDTSTGVVLAQVQVAAKSNESPCAGHAAMA